MRVQFSIECDAGGIPSGMQKATERDKAILRIQREMTHLLGREVEVWDDRQFNRVSFTIEG